MYFYSLSWSDIFICLWLIIISYSIHLINFCITVEITFNPYLNHFITLFNSYHNCSDFYINLINSLLHPINHVPLTTFTTHQYYHNVTPHQHDKPLPFHSHSIHLLSRSGTSHNFIIITHLYHVQSTSFIIVIFIFHIHSSNLFVVKTHKISILILITILHAMAHYEMITPLNLFAPQYLHLPILIIQDDIQKIHFVAIN